MGGAMEVVASAPHPGIARFRAEQIDKSIQWDNNLFKSETDEIYSLEKAKTISIIDESGKAVGTTTDEERKQQQEAKLQDAMNWSTPENHYKHAQHQSHLAGQWATKDADDYASKHDKNMHILMHTDEALKHYKMAGLEHSQALEQHQKNMAMHHTIDSSYNSPVTEEGYHAKRMREGHKPVKITGLGYNWSE